MMRKNILFFVLAFSFYHAQEHTVPNVVPPAPESSLRTDFGKVPANEYRGMQNLEIPLTVIEHGNVKIPVSLRYSKLGVKVNDISNDVGVSWIVETGGVINRTIRGKTDELYTSINFNSYNEIDQLNQPDGSSGATLLSSYVTGAFDTENDIYNFVLPGLSGSFYIDQNQQIVLLEKNVACKIEKLQNQLYDFIVSANNGTRYYFGGSNATESTFAMPNNGETNDTNGITSYYLARAIDSNGKVINYHYNELGAIGIPQSQFYRQEFAALEVETCAQFNISNAIVAKTQFRRIKSPKTLNKISYDDVEYVFNRTEVDNAISKLNSIKLYKAGNLMTEYRFNYLNDLGTANILQRFFLNDYEQIIYKNNLPASKEKYYFEYNDPLELPDRLSKGIDFLGYYNGKIHNPHLLPNTQLFGNMTILGQVSVTSSADRRPVFEMAKTGTLKSIVYPTKGKTTFEYESILASKKVSAGQQLDITNEQYTFPDVNPTQVIIHKDSIAGGNIAFRVILRTQGTILAPIYRKVFVKIYNNATNTLLHAQPFQLMKFQDLKVFEYDYPVSPDINFRIELSIDANSIDITASCMIDYQKGYELIEDVGIRLKKIYDETLDGHVNIKRIYYNKLDNIQNKNIRTPYQPTFTSWRYLEKHFDPRACDPNPPVGPPPVPNFVTAAAYIVSLTSNPQSKNMFFPYSDTPTSIDNQGYRFVTVSYGGDNFELGGEEIEFTEITESSLYNLNSPFFYYDEWQLSLEAHLKTQFQEGVFEYNTGGRILMKRTFDHQMNLKRIEENSYDISSTTGTYNMTGTQIYNKYIYPPGVSPGTTTSNFYLMYYPLQAFTVLKTKSVIREFVNMVSAVPSVSTVGDIVNIIDYTYGPVHYQVTNEKHTFSNGAIQETSYKYAYEKNNQYLLSKNIVGLPLETTVVKRKDSSDIAGKTIAKSNVIYPVSQSEADIKTSGLALPYEVRSIDLLGVNSEEVTYDRYDSKGNLVQYTAKDGVSTTVIWGYHQTKPIVVMRGAKYDEIMENPSIPSLVVASNADDLAGSSNDEATFLVLLDNFRKQPMLKENQITTYTYDPLIGVRSITTPSGIREVYIYDTANRLKEIREQSQTGNILKEFKYNYKP